jgi:hypothetical protein
VFCVSYCSPQVKKGVVELTLIECNHLAAQLRVGAHGAKYWMAVWA